ncbi:major capsid protein [Microviridae sp.]|nr:major capsid protein [Microviridae sp.]
MKIFNQINIKKPKANKFDLSHEKKLSMNMGDLVPIYLEEVVPGDKFKLSSEIFIRLAPMLAPVMHRINVYTHYFFVPNRIIWDNWKEFITGGEDGTVTHDFPRLHVNDANKASYTQGKLPDYMGIPVVKTTDTLVNGNYISALPFRAYQEIYNEYYRDQNVTPKVAYDKGNDSFGNTLQLTQMRKRAWEKDYFTSALPWAQRGGDVTLPTTFTPQYNDVSIIKNQDGSSITGNGSVNYSDSGSPATIGGIAGPTGNARIENLSSEQQGVSVTINELRTATRLQEWLEKNARGGSRYIEQILSHFGVRSSDARLQRPEYLGGGKNNVVISEVLNQAGDAPTEQQPSNPLAPVGQQYGHGISVGKNNGFKRSFEEHGYIIGIMSVLPRTGYQQGIERTFSKFDKLDYYWPEFAHLGEQEIKQREIYFDPAKEDSLNQVTFGYTPRYAEYKYKQTSVHGEFRQGGTDPADINLSYWHMARYFANEPTLSTQFMESDPKRDIFAVTDSQVDTLYCQIYNKVSAIRPMPYFGTPYL